MVALALTNLMENTKPNCFDCVHRRNVPGNCHIKCNNTTAKVSGNPQGIRRGWFMWPFNFDPVWLALCDGFSADPADNKPEAKTDPLLEILSMLR